MKESAGVALVRVDNRLVHGQVLEAWLPALGAHGILVADDEAAGNVLARSAMALAIPPKVSFQVVRVDAAAELLKPGGKVLAVAPTRYDIDFWFNACFPWQRWFARENGFRRKHSSVNINAYRVIADYRSTMQLQFRVH